MRDSEKQASERSLQQVELSLAAAVRSRMEDHTRATKQARKRELALKRYARREKDLVALLHLLNESRYTQAVRRTYAYGEVIMGVLVFMVLLVALAIVTPFAPDYNTNRMFQLASAVDSDFSATLEGVSTAEEWRQWLDNTFIGAGGGGSALVNRTDGTMSIFGHSLVGPIRVAATHWAPAVLTATMGAVATQLEPFHCDVPESLRAVLGACGGAGVGPRANLVSATNVQPDGQLEVVEYARTVGGPLADIQASLAALTQDPTSFLRGPDVTALQVDLSLFSPHTNLFVGVQLTTEVDGNQDAGGGGADHSMVHARPLRLFHARFPPSLAFEAVVAGIVLIQLLTLLVHVCRSPLGPLNYLRAHLGIFDLALLGLCTWLLLRDVQLRASAQHVHDQILGYGAKLQSMGKGELCCFAALLLYAHALSHSLTLCLCVCMCACVCVYPSPGWPDQLWRVRSG